MAEDGTATLSSPLLTTDTRPLHDAAMTSPAARTRTGGVQPAASVDDVYDVIVIGAGASGIAACDSLTATSSRLKVLCLEARNRLGGRVYTVNAGDTKNWSDLGGAYVGPTQDALLHWATRAGVQTYKVHTAGKNIFAVEGRRVVHEGTVPTLDPLSLLDINQLLVRTDAMAEKVPLHEPDKTPDAAHLDTLTVHKWLRKNAQTKLGAAGLIGASTSILTSEASEQSLLGWLWYVRSGGSSLRLVEAENGAQERKFLGGSGAVLEGVAALLPPGTIQYNSPVRVIRNWDRMEAGSLAEVETRDGRIYRARRIIMAMAPTLYGRLEYSPPLPALRQQLVQRMPMGCIIKTVVYYDRAWWREAGFSGSVLSDEGPVWYSYDDCKPDGSKPAIMGFVLSRFARKFGDASKEERLAAITQQYAKLFGCEEALHPSMYEELDWSAEEFSAGCHVGVMPPQFITNYFHKMRTPMGRVHFAGTETAYEWSGYIDGAIRAGDRASNEVVEELIAHDRVAGVKAKGLTQYPPSTECVVRPIGPTAIEKLLPTPRQVVFSCLTLVAAAAAVIAWRFAPK